MRLCNINYSHTTNRIDLELSERLKIGNNKIRTYRRAEDYACSNPDERKSRQ